MTSRHSAEPARLVLDECQQYLCTGDKALTKEIAGRLVRLAEMGRLINREIVTTSTQGAASTPPRTVAAPRHPAPAYQHEVHPS